MNIEQFDYSTNLLAAVLWQYNEATNLLGLLNQKQTWWDTNFTEFWENWYTQVFNLGANNPDISLFGLAVWSIILNVPLFVPLSEVGATIVWGFNKFINSQSATLDSTTTVTGLDTTDLSAGMGVFGADIPISTIIDSVTNSTTIVLNNAATATTTETLYFYENSNLNFGNPANPSLGAPFPPTTPVIYLTAPQQQFLLLLKYFNCTNRGTISGIGGNIYTQDTTPEMIYTNNFVYNINYYLQWLLSNMAESIGYGEGNTIFCEDNLNMTITYTFSDAEAFPSNLLMAINYLDLFPRPAGVAIT